MPAEGEDDYSHIPIALAALQARIGAVASACGRPANSVTLVAVSKTQTGSAVETALGAGQLCFGENRVQEAAEKFPGLRAAWPGLKLHLIGGLQTNKAEDAVRLADMIESLDRPRLAEAIARAADKAGRMPELLVQVNIGDETQKSGVPKADADVFIESCQARFGARLRGLMCIPPADEDPVLYFEALAAMAARHGLGVLSMGMSADFEAAIRAGATHVRIGSALFGKRKKAVLF
jgi:pyridoxal phosphate enzyme (YggS family)